MKLNSAVSTTKKSTWLLSNIKNAFIWLWILWVPFSGWYLLMNWDRSFWWAEKTIIATKKSCSQALDLTRINTKNGHNLDKQAEKIIAEVSRSVNCKIKDYAWYENIPYWSFSQETTALLMIGKVEINQKTSEEASNVMEQISEIVGKETFNKRKNNELAKLNKIPEKPKRKARR